MFANYLETPRYEQTDEKKQTGYLWNLFLGIIKKNILEDDSDAMMNEYTLMLMMTNWISYGYIDLQYSIFWVNLLCINVL